jgi:preprotein translocase subunit SecE
MSKEKSFPAASLLLELFQGGVYKRSQGKATRQVTFGVLAASFALAAWRSWGVMATGPGEQFQWVVPMVLLVAGLWLSFRVVNIPRFADFLIAVEAEMNKVSWPTRTELFRSSLVVILMIFVLAAVLFAFDVFWQFVFSNKVLGILK